jgi:hypothetical protein
MENANAIDSFGAGVSRGGQVIEGGMACGFYTAECRGADGELKWTEEFENTVMNEGKNHMLTAGLKTTTTVVGPFLGLISSASYVSVPVVGDTQASHATWVEAGTTNAPQWTSPASGARQTLVPGAPSAGSTTCPAVSFSISTSGTIKGCFVVTGTGAVATNLNTSGSLWSAGLFAADKVVSSGDTLTVTYTTSL